MKNLLLIAFAILCFLTSCNSYKSDSTDPMTEVVNSKMAAPNETATDYVALLGSYTGAFGDSKITVLLTTITKDSVKGSSIVAGNDRPFLGIVEMNSEGKMLVQAKEPGTDQHDGTFTFSVDTTGLRGSWQPYDSAIGKAKQFFLTKKLFSYDPKVGETESSIRLLKTADVENVDKYYLAFMRNEIFARHGYSFTRRETRQMFEGADWYVPRSVNVTNELTDIEKKNIALIKNYEKYAKDFGDEYGR